MATLYKRGDTFWIQYTVRGKRVQESTKIPTSQPRLARGYLAEVEAKLARGHIGWEVQSPTIMEACQKYLDTVKATKKPSTLERYKEILNHFLEFFGERWPTKRLLMEISHDHVQQFINYRSGIRNVGTVSHEAIVLGIFFNWCVKYDFIKDSPAKKIEKPQPPEKKHEYFSPEQVRRIFTAVEGTPWRDFYEFLYRSFARLQEALDMQVGQIKLDRTPPVILFHNFKAGRDDEVQISSKLLPILRRRCRGRAPEEYLFPEIRELSHGTPLAHFKTLLRSLNPPIPFGNLHAWRHTGISHLVLPPDPVPLAIVQKLARHRNIETTMGYAHLAPDTANGFINNVPV